MNTPYYSCGWEEIPSALYVGIEGYGTEYAGEKDVWRYCFLVREMQCSFVIHPEPACRLQNLLEPGRSYRIRVSGDILLEAVLLEELTAREDVPGEEWRPRVKGAPGRQTLKNFLALALEPVGNVLYVFGGGWNWQDTGTGRLAGRIGVQKSWRRFFKEQTPLYKYREDSDKEHSYYPVQGCNVYGYAGLDCSGYVGWTVYNLLQVKDGRGGYVRRAERQAWDFARELHFGSFTREIPDSSVFLPGDIFSLEGHVWICLGRCSDKSLVILHSTPSESRAGCPGGGVQLTGLGESKDCEAYRLADTYMSRYYKEWSSRYQAVQKSYARYTQMTVPTAGRFSWRVGRGGLTDPEGFRKKGAEEILKELFEE